MRTLRRIGTRRRKGATLLEFAFVLPLILVLITFSIDMGRVMMISGGLADATSVAARRAALFGATGDSGSGIARQAFNEQISVVPGLSDSVARAGGDGFRVVGGGVCSSANPYVRVRGQANIRFITPGMDQLLGLAGGRSNIGSGMNVSYTAVARCEVGLR
jgi:hypothetical protein